jgi:hypothetical protein
MRSKQNTRRGTESHGKENWKRKREGNNTSNDGSSTSHPSKKSRRTPHEPQPELADASPNVNNSSFPTTISPAELPSIPNDLATTHEITSINIISSTQIQKKVTQTLTTLSSYPTIPPAKTPLVILRAKAPVASKLITIAEIAKREIGKGGGKWFQYNKLEGITVEVERKESPKKDGRGEAGVKNGGDEEEGQDGEEGDRFEVMKTPFERSIEGKVKIRETPVMTLYLSRVRVDSLRRAYG